MTIANSGRKYYLSVFGMDGATLIDQEEHSSVEEAMNTAEEKYLSVLQNLQIISHPLYTTFTDGEDIAVIAYDSDVVRFKDRPVKIFIERQDYLGQSSTMLHSSW